MVKKIVVTQKKSEEQPQEKQSERNASYWREQREALEEKRQYEEEVRLRDLPEVLKQKETELTEWSVKLENKEQRFTSKNDTGRI